MTDLDSRMGAASDALLRASERLSPPATPRSLRRLGAAAGAFVSLAVLTAGVAVLQGGDGTANVSAGSPAVPRLIPDAVPRSLEPTGAIELPASEQTRFGHFSLEVYGDSGADDPFAGADLAVMVFESGTLASEGDPVDIRGHEGMSDQDEVHGASLAWEEATGFHVALASHSLHRDQLLEVAAGLAVDAGERTVELGELPDRLPGRLAPVGTVHEMSLGPLVTVPTAADGHVLGYQAGGGPDDVGTSAVVGLFTGNVADLAVIRWWTGADTATEVRGRPAWSGAQSPASTLIWEESPGVLAFVRVVGTGAEDARDLAESLRPASDTEWTRLLDLGAGTDVVIPGDASPATTAPDTPTIG